MCLAALPAVPAWMSYASMAISAVSGVMQAVGSMQQGQGQKQQADYQAAIQRNNAVAAGYAADDAIQRGKVAEQQQRLKGRLLLGQMNAALAANGQVVNQDSAGQMVIDQAGANEFEAQQVRNNAEREAYRFRIQQGNFEANANLSQIQGANAYSSGVTSAAGSLLSTAGKVASQWYQLGDPNPYSGGTGGRSTSDSDYYMMNVG